MNIERAFSHAKFNQTLLVSPVGLCFVITPASRPLEGDPSLAKAQFKNRYWAKHLLRSHSNRWGYRFDLLKLYHQLHPTPLQHHKTRDDIIDEVSQRIAHGEFLVYNVHNFIAPPPEATNADVPMASPVANVVAAAAQTKALTTGGKDETVAPTETLDITCTLPDGQPAADLPYQVKLLASGTVMSGTFDASGSQHFDNLKPGNVEVTYGTPITEADIDATRQKINRVLAGIISAQQAEAAKLEAEYSQLNAFQKAGSMIGSVATGVYDAGVGLLEFVVNVSEATSTSATIQRVALSAWKANNTVTDSWLSNFASNYSDSQHQAYVKAIGFDPTTISKKTIAEAYEIASFIKSDSATQAALLNFAKQYAEAQHELEWAEVAGGAIFEIVLTALIAVATGGVGVAGTLASKAHLASHFSKLGNLLQTLTKQLKQKAQYKLKRGKTNGAVEHQIKRPDGAEIPTKMKAIDAKPIGLAARRGIAPHSLDDAKARLASMADVIAKNGYQPKYTDAELIAMAKAGNVANERFHVRFMNSEYVNNGEGKLGLPMEGQTGNGAKYWSTTFDQIEDADTDFELIAKKLGLGDDYNPETDYSLIVIDTDKAKELTGVKTVSATFENLSDFVITELPNKFDKKITDTIMNGEFQIFYAKHYTAANNDNFLEWRTDTKGFERYLNSQEIDKTSKTSLYKRMIMHDLIGNNQDFLGNGLTMNQIRSSINKYGAVETFNFEREIITLNQLDAINAIIYVNK